MTLPRPCLLPSPALFQQHGQTALMYGAYNGHVPVVEMLVAKGAKMDLQNKVRLGAAMGHVPVVEMLVTKGAKMDLQDKVRGP